MATTHFRALAQNQTTLVDSASFTITAGTASSNIALVTFALKDGSGLPITRPIHMTIWLSDLATGLGVTATTASGAVAAGTNGTDLSDITAKKIKSVITDVNGYYQLSITDTAKTGFYVVCSIPGVAKIMVSPQLVTANYG